MRCAQFIHLGLSVSGAHLCTWLSKDANVFTCNLDSFVTVRLNSPVLHIPNGCNSQQSGAWTPQWPVAWTPQWPGPLSGLDPSVACGLDPSVACGLDPSVAWTPQWPGPLSGLWPGPLSGLWPGPLSGLDPSAAVRGLVVS